jgi:hypothetical protein
MRNRARLGPFIVVAFCGNLGTKGKFPHWFSGYEINGNVVSIHWSASQRWGSSQMVWACLQAQRLCLYLLPKSSTTLRTLCLKFQLRMRTVFHDPPQTKQ